MRYPYDHDDCELPISTSGGFAAFGFYDPGESVVKVGIVDCPGERVVSWHRLEHPSSGLYALGPRSGGMFPSFVYLTG